MWENSNNSLKIHFIIITFTLFPFFLSECEISFNGPATVLWRSVTRDAVNFVLAFLQDCYFWKKYCLTRVFFIHFYTVIDFPQRTGGKRNVWWIKIKSAFICVDIKYYKERKVRFQVNLSCFTCSSMLCMFNENHYSLKLSFLFIPNKFCESYWSFSVLRVPTHGLFLHTTFL